MRNAILVATVLAAVAASTTGCGYARVVQRSQYGGIIALQGARQPAMQDAYNQMAAHCGGGQYTIVEEGERVVGQTTTVGADTQYYDDGEQTVATAQTRDAVEWRIRYECGAGGGAPPNQPGQVPQPAYDTQKGDEGYIAPRPGSEDDDSGDY